MWGASGRGLGGGVRGGKVFTNPPAQTSGRYTTVEGLIRQVAVDLANAGVVGEIGDGDGFDDPIEGLVTRVDELFSAVSPSKPIVVRVVDPLALSFIGAHTSEISSAGTGADGFGQQGGDRGGGGGGRGVGGIGVGGAAAGDDCNLRVVEW